MKSIKIFSIVLLLFNAHYLAAQTAIKWSGLPFAFFTPETGLGFGGLVNANFYLQDSTYRPSTFLLGGAYTLQNQLLTYVPFEFNWSQNTYIVKGEIGYYRYFYNYYGIGPEFREDFEVFTVNFPRFRIIALYRFYGNHYAGVTYNFDDYNIRALDDSGTLLNDRIPGYLGSVVSRLGFIHTFDSRDYIFSATKGWFITTRIEHNGTVTGSDFTFSRVTSDAIRYITLDKHHILALNLYGGLIFGTPPFQEYLLYGGTNKARGYYEGYYRDHALLLFQTEYRVDLWKRFGAVIFGSLGNVGPRLDQIPLSSMKWNAGLGFRYMINPVDRLNVRIDYAIGRKTSGFYITFGEAF